MRGLIRVARALTCCKHPEAVVLANVAMCKSCGASRSVDSQQWSRAELVQQVADERAALGATEAEGAREEVCELLWELLGASGEDELRRAVGELRWLAAFQSKGPWSI
jgi:hypothetical protein